MTTHEILVKARALLAEEGWLQKNLGGMSEGFCALGAVNMAAYRSPFARKSDEREEVLIPLVEAIGIPCAPARTPGPPRDRACLVAWNNTPGRTQAEVLAAFDRAIAATAPIPSEDPNPEDYLPLFEKARELVTA